MAVKIGHARGSEYGTITGNAGDNNGKEVSVTDWYLHKSGWVVLRCKDPAKRELIARAMEKACANNDIGYDQYQRNTLFNNVKDKGFDPSKTSKKVEADCSSLVRVCIAYAYGKDLVGNIRTVTQPNTLVNTGEFQKLTDSKYTKGTAYLKRGDIICTPVSGHTAVVLGDGISTEDDPTTGTGNEEKESLLGSLFNINWVDISVVLISVLLVIGGVIMLVLGVKGAVVDNIKEVL